jgi:hypothetical protein
MLIKTIADPHNKKYPFPKSFFHDPDILYHGTWSAYANRIDEEGFVNSDLPFSVSHLRTISDAGVALGIGSYGRDLFFSNEGGGGKEGVELSMANSFWGAREYSTDEGGEVVRIMLREAKNAERFGTDEEVRLRWKSECEDGLKTHPDHAPTKAVVKLLSTTSEMDRLCSGVRHAREAIEAVTRGGFPVVYAIRVEPDWFGEQWERHLYQISDGMRTEELSCLRSLIAAARLVAKAEYPNGTSTHFSPGTFDWSELQEMDLVDDSASADQALGGG